MEQIGAANWDKVDLSEWTNMLDENGITEKFENIDMDSMTGEGSAFSGLSPDGDRMNATGRTLERFKDMPLDDIRRKSYEDTGVHTSIRHLAIHT